MNTPHSLVIGGGFAGISAARNLLSRGARVTVIDARSTLGGRARSDLFADLDIDTGAQLVASSFSRTMHLFERTAAAVPRSPERAPGRDAIVLGGDRLEIQFGSLRSLLGFAGLSAMDKLRLGRHLLPLIARHRSHLDAGATRLPHGVDAESAGHFVRTHVGARAAEMLAETTANAFYGATADETSLGFLLTLGRYGSDAGMFAARGGWSALLRAAAADAAVVGDTRIVALAERSGTVMAVASDGREWSADKVVIATGPRTAGELLAAANLTAPALLEWLAKLPLRPTVTLALAVDAPLERNYFGLFRARSEARVVSACAAHGAKLPGLSLSRDVALAWPTPEHARALSEAPADEVVEAMLPEIEELLPGVRGRVTAARLYRFEEGTPLPHPGFAADRARGRRLAGSLPPHIALAGDYLSAPLIEGAVLSGEWAAARLFDADDRR